MAVTMEQVMASLQSDEPDYQGASSLGPDALPHLEKLVTEGDALLASKAAYLAGLIAGPSSGPILMIAAKSPDPGTRAAAAAASANLPAAISGPVLTQLLKDPTADVRRIAVQSVQPNATAELRSAVKTSAQTETDPSIRSLLHGTLQKLNIP